MHVKITTATRVTTQLQLIIIIIIIIIIIPTELPGPPSDEKDIFIMWRMRRRLKEETLEHFVDDDTEKL